MLIKETAGACLPDAGAGSFRAGFLTPTGALYIGVPLDAAAHEAHAHKVYVALRGEFQLFMGHARRGEFCRAAIVAPDQLHRIEGRQAILAIFFLVPETLEGQRVSRLLCGKAVSSPSAETIKELVPRLRQYPERGCSSEEAGEACDYLFNNLIPGCHDVKTLFEPRVAGATEYLNCHMDRRVTVAELAAAVGLSVSRLEHLFAEEVGIPISRYLLSLRVRSALREMAAGRP